MCQLRIRGTYRSSIRVETRNCTSILREEQITNSYREYLHPLIPEDFKTGGPPPARLYKYLVGDRVPDVLNGGMVRFTHLLDTNDSFEVRKTFKRFAGPKFNDLIMRSARSTLTIDYVNQRIQENLESSGIKTSPEAARTIMEKFLGMPLEEALSIQVESLLVSLSSSINNLKSPEEFLMEFGSKALCFSLSERWDIATMWAHYAGGHTGFVVEFDTNHPWFLNDGDPKKSKLLQIKYLDEQKEELFDDLQSALCSKASDWSYEREWRMNCSMEQIEKIHDLGSEKIYLRSFPAKTVSSIIIGYKASEITVERIREAIKESYPHARLYRSSPQRMSSNYILDGVPL